MAPRILVVEDNPQNRMLIKDLLEFHGFEVLEVANGEEGIAAARKEMPDLILMDLQMPVLDGFAAGKILREDPATKHIKIIAVTSFAMVGDRERVKAAGFDDYISKPIDTRGLPTLLKKMLER
ncbi:MAG: response regulator [Syntrophus sp. (in: bacteria)]|nr:response regulator [Syntrophus sp. (in: bacteria)]